MERGNGHAKHEPERRDSRKELIAAARMQFDALRAVGILTPGPARSIVHLLESDEGTLSMHGRAFRDNIIRYLKKEADFGSVFAEMLQIDGAGAEPAPSAKRRRLGPKPPILGASAPAHRPKRPSWINGSGWARKVRHATLSLPYMKAFFITALIAAAAIIPAMSVFFAPSHESLSPPPRAASLAVDSDAASVPSAPAPAIFPSAISPARAGEEPYEASLNTCYDQYKANRESNANGGLSWNQSLKHLKP